MKRSKELRYEIVRSKNGNITTIYFVTTKVEKSVLRFMYKIVQKQALDNKAKVQCIIRTLVDESLMDEFSVNKTFTITSEKTFIKTVLDGMKNLKDKQKAYPLEDIVGFIVKVYEPKQAEVMKSKPFVSGRRDYSTMIRALRAKTLNFKKKNLMVFDIETVHEDKSFIPYAIGIRSSSLNKIFYITDYEEKDFVSRSKFMMKDFISFLINCTGSSNKTIFAHNLGNFDGYFLLKGLLENNIKVNLLIDEQNAIITLNFKNVKGKTITFKDSLRILPSSLKDLSLIYDVEYKKLDFAHSAVTLDQVLYSKTFKDYLVLYLKSDLLSLHEILLKSSKFINDEYKVDLLSCFSTASLAMMIFRTQFLKNEIETLPRYYDKIIRESYFGGIVNVYKPHGKNLYYYDVNSLYPFAMLKDMPGLFLGVKKNVNLDTFFGFVKAQIKVPKNTKYPFAPYRTEEGNLITPTGKWTGLYFSEELKDFVRRGYKVTPLVGYEHERIQLFNDYVDHFYNLKKNTKGSERLVYHQAFVKWSLWILWKKTYRKSS